MTSPGYRWGAVSCSRCVSMELPVSRSWPLSSLSVRTQDKKPVRRFRSAGGQAWAQQSRGLEARIPAREPKGPFKGFK